MSNKKEFDILLHFMTVKSGKASTVPKKQPFPVNIKSIIPSYIDFTASEITTKMSLQSIESLLSTLVNTADICGFDHLKSRHFLDKNQFFSGSYLYGIVDNDVDIDDSTNSAINHAWVAAKDESTWRAIVNNAKELYEKETVLGRTRNGKANLPIVKDVFVSRTLHLVVLVSIETKRVPKAPKAKKKRATPSLSSDAVQTTAAKVAKVAESTRLKLQFSNLQLEINSPEGQGLKE